MKPIGDLPLFRYPLSPGFKTEGTSKDAALAVSSRASVLRERVHAEIAAAGRSGLTADQVAARLGESVLSVRPRLSELYRACPPRIEPTGERRTNDSRLKAKCWRTA